VLSCWTLKSMTRLMNCTLFGGNEHKCVSMLFIINEL